MSYAGDCGTAARESKLSGSTLQHWVVARMVENREPAVTACRIYFSEIFGVSADVLADYGAFDVSLINDLPLFIDPFLLFHSEKAEYRFLHDAIIRYLKFLCDKSATGDIQFGLLESWFTFREVKQNWLGYSLVGNSGRGLGIKFANALRANLNNVFKNFGNEEISKSSHLEKLCLIADDVGRDNISDFATNLIKEFLLEFTQTFAREYLFPHQRRSVNVQKVRFNYVTESWEARRFELPFVSQDFVLLTPLDMLTKDDVWINRADLTKKYADVIASVDNDQLRSQLSNFFASALAKIRADDETARRLAAENNLRQRKRRTASGTADGGTPTQSQEERAALQAIAEYPEFIDYFVRYKEEHGDEAEAQADERVRSSEQLYIVQVRDLTAKLARLTAFYSVAGDTYGEARQRVMFLKDVIEHRGGHRLFYVGDEPIRREADLHILFRLTWCNTPSDVNREVNNGRGPSDFEVSRGRFDKSIVEFKLASNTGLRKNLQNQVEIYKNASEASNAIKVIVYFTEDQLARVRGILNDIGLAGHRDVVLIDARTDNKRSASVSDSHA